MKIASVAYRVPSRVFTNADMIDHVDRLNPDVSSLRKSIYFRMVNTLYNRLGAQTRHFRDTEGGEKAADVILGAMDDALDRAGMAPEDIDVLIYCGVGRGFIEPANAYFYAQSRGMRRANCFDVIDACMSWVRAMQIGNMMLRAGTARSVMVINGEFHLGIHDQWKIGSIDALAYNFPMFTIGEASTATILLPDERDWRFDFLSCPELADLCTIPLEAWSEFVAPSNRIGLNGAGKFVSFGRELFDEGRGMISHLIRTKISDVDAHSLYFPHAPAKGIVEQTLAECGVKRDKMFLEVFPRFGNVVSASVPLGLALAEEMGSLRRGDSMAFVPVSAGMVASVVQTTF